MAYSCSFVGRTWVAQFPPREPKLVGDAPEEAVMET
jgi:hypothetical protein